MENEKFAEYTENLMNVQKSVSRGLSLLSFLIKPVQRLCKYPLLLRELINLTDPTTQEHDRLQEAAKKVGDAVGYVNQMQNEAQAKANKKLEDLMQIEKSIDGVELLQISNDKNRVLFRSGLLNVFNVKKKNLVPRMIYLFNNLILVAKKNEKKKKNKKDYILDYSVSIKNLVWVDMSMLADVKFGFELKNKETGMAVIICCNDLNEKRDWIKSIKGLVKDHQYAEVKRRATALGMQSTSTAVKRSNSFSTMTGSRERSTSRTKAGGSSQLGLHGLDPPPPDDDGKADWKEKQDLEDSAPIEPNNFVAPPQWSCWLEYHSIEYGIPFYYNIQSKQTTWSRPSGWTLNNNIK